MIRNVGNLHIYDMVICSMIQESPGGYNGNAFFTDER